VLALIGNLGVGKTTLIRGIAAGLGVPPTSVSSPTFVLIHEYQGRLPLVHIDLYRLRHEAEAAVIGLAEQFNDTAVTAIEWADRFPSLLPGDRLEIELAHCSPGTRTARLRASGPRSMALISRLRKVRPVSRASARSRRMNGQTQTARRVRA